MIRRTTRSTRNDTLLTSTTLFRSGVAHLAAHKCAQNNILLGDIPVASRTLSKCKAIITSIKEKNSQCGPGRLQAHALDALDVAATQDLIESTGSHMVINGGSPLINMAVITACIESGAAYLETAIHEDINTVRSEKTTYELPSLMRN